MRDGTRALQVGEHHAFTRQDNKGIFIQPLLILARDPGAARNPMPGDVRKEVVSQRGVHG